MAVHRVGIDPIVSEAMDRFEDAAEAEELQRTAILAAKTFRAGEQWDPEIRQARAGKTALQGVAAQPPRPCLTIDRLSQPVRQVSNQIKTADFAIDVLPNGGGADEATAAIIKGYLRRVQNLARAESPIEWAADQAIEGGIGWFRLRTDYVQEAPPANGQADASLFDQELRLERIANNLTVYCDPYASKPTRSDARYMLVTEDLAREEYVRRWGDDDVASLDDFAATGNDTKGWVDQDTIRIAEYWRVVYQTEYWVATDQGVQQVEKFDKETPAHKRRTVRRPVVEGYKINAVRVLDRWQWLGRRIPLFPILGEELNVDGKAILRGIVSEGMDAQRMVNFMYSGAVEQFAMMPKAPILAATGAVDTYKDIYQTANWYNYSWLPYDKYDSNGREMPEPHPLVRDASALSAAVELMNVSEAAIKATTGIYSEFLGESDPRHRSGRAIQALQGQSDLANSNYGSSVLRALVDCGNEMVFIMPQITRPGQLVSILGLDDEPQQVLIGQPFQQGKPGDAPQALDPSRAAELLAMKQGAVQFYDLSKGTYAVTITIGKASATKREEGAAALGELIPHLPPEMAAVATPDYVEQLSFPGSHKIAEKLRKSLPPQLRGDDGQGEQADPEKQQMAQQIQQLQQALQGQEAQERAKQEAVTQRELAKAQLDAQTKLQLAQQDAATTADRELALQAMKNAATIAVAHINAHAKGADIAAHATEEAAALGHDALQADLDRQHERDLAAQDHAQTLDQQQQQADQQAQAQQADTAPV